MVGLEDSAYKAGFRRVGRVFEAHLRDFAMHRTLSFVLMLVATVVFADTTNELRSVDKAITATVAPPGAAGHTGYFGAAVKKDNERRLAVEEVQPDSPAAKAGLRKGDVITK